MKSRRAALGFAMLALACAPKGAPDDNGGRSGPLQSRLKAQTTTLTATETATSTHTFTGTRTGTAPGIYQQIYTFTGTITATSTGIVYYASWPHSQGNTATATTNQFASGTAMTTVTRTVTSPSGGTETKTASATVTGSGTKTGTATVTVTATVTTGTTNAGTGTRTLTATGTATGTATQTWTATWTTQVTQTVTNTNTDTVTTTVTLTMTATDTDVDAGTGDGGSGSCLQNWRTTTCGDWCLRETQEDRRHCTDFLDCYFQNGVGPTDNPDGTCGVNHFSYGMAPKTIADQVYQCLACPGTSPVTSCAGVPNTAPCTDNNACTTGDMCVGGACRAGGPRDCSDGNVCTDDSCNQATGCVHVNNTAPCDDGNACTTNDICAGGACAGGPAPSCDDGNVCTDDSCNPATGCVYTNNTASCDDGSACTQTDICVAGVCTGTNPVGCPASDQCHVGVCDPATGNCSDEPVDGDTCADGNGCTTGDTCENGVCVGSGSGFVGPGEQCAPAMPTTPGPFGDFHCLLEEVPGTAKNILHLEGTLSGTWILRGTMDFSLTAAGAKLTKVSVTGQEDRLSLQNGIVLALDRNATSSGSVDTTNGNVQVTLPVLAFGPSGDKVTLSLEFVGQIGDRVLQGSAAASGAATAQIQLFCREQFMNTVASVTFQLDQTGNFVAQGPIDIFGGTPTMPGPRPIPGPHDLVAEFVSITGEILDQYGIGQPWDPTGTSDVTVRPPLSNRLGAVTLRTADGNALATAGLSAAIDSFCGGAGSQYCDYRAAAPVREVLYAADMRPRILDLEPPTSDNPNQIRPLPASSRLDGETRTIASGARDIQPSVALDSSGNAVVVWRRLLDDGPSSRYDIMAQGISNDGTVAFGPVRVNDPYCSSSPGEEYSRSGPLTFRPRVARSPDGTFVVAWGGYYPLLLGAGSEEARFVHAGNICARVLNADGTFLTDHPISVVTDADLDLVNVATGPIDWWTTYFDVAIADWPPPTPRHSFIVTWSGRYPEFSPRHDNDWYKIWARSFGPDGEPLSGPEPVLMGLNNSAHLLYPTVAASRDGFAVIAWLEASGQVTSSASGLAGHAKMQRAYPNMITKVGGPIDGPSIAGIPDVALAQDRETFGLVGRVGTETIWSATYDFGSGNAIGTILTMNARHGGKQRRPVLANGADGELMAAWMDDVGIGSGTGSVVAAQLFDGSSLPEDIDFTVSTQAAIDVPKVPDLADASSVAAECQAADEPLDYCARGDDPYLFQDGFGFDVATSGQHFAVVWQSTDGIQLQRIRGGQPECPAPTDCGSAVPIRITGAAKDKIDVILSPGKVVRDDTGEDWIGGPRPYTSNAEFAMKAVDLIANGYLTNNSFSKYAGEFNFYYDMTQGIRRMTFVGETCDHLRGELPDTPRGAAIRNAIGYNGDKTFADVAGVVFRRHDWDTNCRPDEGKSETRDSYDARSSELRTFWIRSADSYSTLLHESGHATFGLMEEYCPGAAEDTEYHSNAFESLARCRDFSVDPDKEIHCRAIRGCTVEKWKADPDDCPMTLTSTGTQFGYDCQRRAQCVVEMLSASECP